MTALAGLILAPDCTAAPLAPLAAVPADAVFSDLPPPPDSVDFDADQRLELALIVNGMDNGVTASVLKQGARFQVKVADLLRAGMIVQSADDLLFLDSLDGVAADYDAGRQQLLLTVLPRYLPAQTIGQGDRVFRPAMRDMGGLLNYDAYATGGVGGGGGIPFQASLWHEARLFGPAGVFSTTGALRTHSGFGAGGAYMRYDTYWRWSDERSMTTVEAGDVITRSLSWAPAVRLGGAQVSRDFSVRPDVITYPLPEFGGSATLPSTVDLVVNGQRIAGSRVNPGPFALDTLPPITGSGQANLIVTDVHGRSVVTSVPFYVSSTLLRPGFTDYSAAAGAFRRNYGLRSFDYGALAATAYLRHGLTSTLTVELRGETTQDLHLLGAGAVARIGNLGVVSASYSRSFGTGTGGELSVGYEFQARTFSIGLRHTRHDRDYFDLGRLERDERGWEYNQSGGQGGGQGVGVRDEPGRERGWERQTAATASLALGSTGTLGVGYFDLRQENARNARLANLSWTLPLWGQSRLYATLSRTFAGGVGNRWSGALTLTVPLGSGNVSGGVTRDDRGRTGLRADYTRPIPSEGGFGWNASAYSDSGEKPYLRGDLAWRTQPIQLRAGVYGRGDMTGWFGASGALVFMDGGLFAANRVTDAFALVSTNGEAGIPVRYENQVIGRTDRNGQLLVPTASAWYLAHYDIDTLSLPPSVQADRVSRRVAVAAGSGYVVRFPVERVAAARAVIVDAAGQPLPAGTVAVLNDSGKTYVGWDGMLYLERVAATNTLDVALSEGRHCRVRFAAGDPGDGILDLGTLTCP
jgi:outer membrane usher protein